MNAFAMHVTVISSHASRFFPPAGLGIDCASAYPCPERRGACLERRNQARNSDTGFGNPMQTFGNNAREVRNQVQEPSLLIQEPDPDNSGTSARPGSTCRCRINA